MIEIPEHIHSLIQTLDSPHTFLLAVSGGSDSMVLLHAFSKLQFSYEVAHVNYGFRAEADDEERLVSEFCTQNDIQLHTLKLNGYSDLEKSEDGNLQSYARQVRYRFFNDVLSKRSLRYMVTAHHAADNAETVLMNIFNSTSFLGLRGMQILEQNIFRPLLDISKRDIQAYAASQSVPYLLDKSNETNDYRRNFIRNEIIPALEERIPQLEQNLMNNLSRWRSVIGFYNHMISNHIHHIIKRDDVKGVSYFNHQKLLKKTYQKDIIQLLLHRYGFSSHQIPEFIKLTSSQNGAYMQSDTFRFLKQNETIFIIDKEDEHSKFTHIEFRLSEIRKQDGLNIKTHMGLVKLRLLDSCEDGSYPAFKDKDFYIRANSFLEESSFTIRNVRPGDYFYPFGLNKKKKLSKYFIDKKIPAHARPHQLVLTHADYILSVLGLGIDHRFACQTGTSIYLKVSLEF